MVKKTLGYVELEWTCPQCGARNPGTANLCQNCSAAQPKQVDFQQAPQEELIADPEQIARAKAGPDVHCAFCGARNPAQATRCVQCGADLSQAAARDQGRVLGALRSGPAAAVTCPSCGTQNDAGARQCRQCGAALPAAPASQPAAAPQALTQGKPAGKMSPLAMLAAGVGVLAVLGLCIWIVVSLLTPRGDITAEVQSVSWTRSIEIEELGGVTREDWRDEIPAGVPVGSCTQRHRYTRDEPAPNATEVCGTPYTVDTGTGLGEVVQDCEYRVYDEWCSYTASEWRKVDTLTAEGTDLDPRWPDANLSSQQREGGHRETYRVVFADGSKTYSYTCDADEYGRFEIGSRWKLKRNVLGGVHPVEQIR